MFVNGLHVIIPTQIARFREEHHRDDMTFARLTQETQEIGNNFGLQMSQLQCRTAMSTSAAIAKMGPSVRPTRTSQPPRQVHFMESTNNLNEG